MEAATATKSAEKRKSRPAPDPATHADGGGAQPAPASGVSVFLQRTALSALSPDVIPRAIDEEHHDDELEGGVQTKLTVSEPGDQFEQEADGVASQVMRKAEGASPAPSSASLSAAPPRTGGSLRAPDAGAPLPPAVRARVEPVLGADLGDVRVHESAPAKRAAKALRAKAFTHGRDIWLGANQRSDDVELMAHEAAHVVQQRAATGLIQRQEADASTSSSEPTGPADPSHQSFGFSEDEMEARLSSTPPSGADASAPTVEVDPSTRSTLSDVEGERGEEGEGEAAPEGEAAARTEGEGRPGEEGEGEGGRGREGEGGRGEGRGGGAGVGGGEAAVGTPGPASEFEGLVSENVSAYLEGNASDEQLAALSPRTQELLEAVDALGDRSITDPEGAALAGLGGEGLEPAAPTTGYEGEPLWLRTLASIRDITGQLGGIVGIIGLVATVSGFILSLLIPPVGAFLLTVGRFCDVAALILDAISLVLGIILTGYNLYRLKNETNPEERRRLLGMVRQDAMGTVMSAVSVATAVAPGAARLLGRSRVGRLAGRGLAAAGRRVSGFVGRLASSPGRLGRALTTVGRVGAAGMSGARRLAAGASGRFHTFFGRVRDFGLRRALGTTLAGRAIRRIGATAVGRGIRRVAGGIGAGARWLARTGPARFLGRAAVGAAGYVRRGARWLAQSRAGRWIAQSRLGRYASRVYGENLNMARLLFARSEIAHHTFVGGELRAELAAAQRTGPLASVATARPALEGRLGDNFPEVDLRNLHVERDASGNFVFARPGDTGAEALASGQIGLQTFLNNMRRDEARAIQSIINTTPGIDDAAIAAQLNARANAPARWTEAEIAAFRAQADVRRVLKTPHHTISVMDAPHMAYDPRYIQLANAPLVTPSPHTAAAGTSPWTVFGTSSARRPPGGVGPALDVPFVRTTDAAEDFARGTSTVMGRPLTAPPGGWPPGYFRSEEFFEQLRLQGNTGVWINPHDPTQRLLFDAHFVAGHRWQTGEAGARAIFGPTVDFAGRFEGEVTRTLLDRTLSTYGRTRRFSEDSRGLGQSASDRMVSGGDRLLEMFGMTGPDALAETELGGEEPSAEGMAPGDEETAGMLPFMMPADEEEAAGMDLGGAPAFASAAAMPLFMMGGAMTGGGGGGSAAGGEGPAAPPTPVLYSPQGLVSIREQRQAIADAIQMVNDYIGETAASEEHNRLAQDAAGDLIERNTAQGEFAQTERSTVAGEQDKLTQAGSAQENMQSENQRASSESDRGKGEADGVQSEGQNVSVEPKPEEPESRSWLERAWDATAGALWDNLIAPAVRAVRRKVQEVMQSINEFIMNMINQALGLDEIEAELNGGGEDIAARDASLGETDTGLQETQDQAAEQAERNQQSMDQAGANIADAQVMREDAQGLRADLLAHDALLQGEEAAGTSYIVDFGATYAPYFEAEAQMGSESPEGAPPEEMGAEGTDMSGMSMMPEPPLESESMSEAGVG